MRIVPLHLAACMVAVSAGFAPAETLHNGIILPSAWPPKVEQEALKQGHVPAPPYLAAPPAVIPVDVGRQLFVDDFLIENTTLQRTNHAARYHPASPVLKPEQPWELKGEPTAMAFSDGAWYDPADRLFKLWYMGGYLASTCLATSRDGLHWDKPLYDVQPGTGIVQPDTRDSATVWLDLAEKDPSRRYKLWRSHKLVAKDRWGLTLHFSPDGIHWSAPVLDTGSCGDRTTVYYDPFRQKWIYSLRASWGVPRLRRYWEVSDLLAGPQWEAIGEPPLWIGADTEDPPRDDLKVPCQLYNLDAVGYESVVLGLFTIWRGQPKDRAKPNEVCIGFSRDGFHWHRPTHEPFIPVSEKQGDWNWGNVQSVGGCCLIVGDELWFYVSGRAGVPGSTKSGVSGTGLATLRRDGFASMDAGDAPGTLTTRPLKFSGGHLFVNADARGGELRAELLDEAGQPIHGFTSEASEPVSVDGTKMKVGWRGNPDLAAYAGKPVRLRFHLRHGRLYSFWITPDPKGASRGATAAGGPRLTGPWDWPQ